MLFSVDRPGLIGVSLLVINFSCVLNPSMKIRRTGHERLLDQTNQTNPLSLFHERQNPCWYLEPS
jgi:hypothetical protein